MCVSHSVHVQVFVTPWIVAHQAPLSMGFSRHEYWSGLSFSSLGDLPDPRIKPASPTLAGRFFTAEPLGKTETIFMEDLLCASSILSPFNILTQSSQQSH